MAGASAPRPSYRALSVEDAREARYRRALLFARAGMTPAAALHHVAADPGDRPAMRPRIERRLAAEAELLAVHDCGPDGLLTYVDAAAVRGTNPGFCFKRAGWRRLGRSAERGREMLGKPAAQGLPPLPLFGAAA